MELLSITQYATSLIHAVLETEPKIIKPSVRKNNSVIRASGWLKGSGRTVFIAIFVYEEANAFRVNIRSNKKGCFHYPAVSKSIITPEKLNQLVQTIILDVNNHIEAAKQKG